MTTSVSTSRPPIFRPTPPALRAGFNLFVIGLTAFLTVVDLFATQAILPELTKAYGVSPAEMGIAVNASTLGMAIAAVAAALLSGHVNRRNSVVASLVLLAIPTALLAHAPNLAVFAALRVTQGLLMATAFTLTLAHLGERCSTAASPAAFAAYVTGNVASNLVGRLMSASAVSAIGVDGNFYLFAVLNVLGGVLVWATLSNAPPNTASASRPGFSILAQHLADPRLRLGFAIGFCILFAFIGVFTYVNFVLAAPPLALGMAGIGLVYFVFAPAIVTTALAGSVVTRLGARTSLASGLGAALLGVPMLLVPNLPIVIAGMVIIGCGTFFAQAVATGFVSRTAETGRGAASGLYLGAYFSGGLVGTAIVGAAFDLGGWPAAVACIAAALFAGLALTATLPSAGASK